MGAPLRIGLVGVGKIARDQHLPALAASPDFVLAAVASRDGRVEGVPGFDTVEAMLAEGPRLDAITICTPPRGRAAIARTALGAGKAVMIEKPPGVTVSEVAALEATAAEAGVTLFAAWHSREAPGVAAARDWLAGRALRSVAITWREDIRVWHPGQAWILEAGGFGVFDAGINALSIATAILPQPLAVLGGELSFPEGREAPIAAALGLVCGPAPVAVDLDFRQIGPQVWDIVVDTDAGQLRLSDGGHRLFVDGAPQPLAEAEAGAEYPRLYRRFAELIADGARDVDVRPLTLVADAFRAAHRTVVAPFAF